MMIVVSVMSMSPFGFRFITSAVEWINKYLEFGMTRMMN